MTQPVQHLSSQSKIHVMHLRPHDDLKASMHEFAARDKIMAGIIATAHLHICLGDQTGMPTGGPLLERNLVYTTAEMAIAQLTGLEFHREPAPVSGYAELEIRQK